MDTNKAGQPQTRLRFADIVNDLEIDWQIVAERSGVSRSNVDTMCVGTAIPRVYAERVVEQIALITEQPISLETIDAPTMSTTFADLFLLHPFDTRMLAVRAGVILETVDLMIVNQPVPRQAAERVLDALSKITGQNYNLRNIEVELKKVPDWTAKREV